MPAASLSRPLAGGSSYDITMTEASAAIFTGPDLGIHFVCFAFRLVTGLWEERGSAVRRGWQRLPQRSRFGKA